MLRCIAPSITVAAGWWWQADILSSSHLPYPLSLTKLSAAKITFQADNHFAFPGLSDVEIITE